MKITEMDKTLSLLNDLFRYAGKKEAVRIYSKSRNYYENHQAGWLLRGDNLRKTMLRFPAGDLYISFNTFKNTGRKKKNGSGSKNALFNVYNFCIDVDYKAGADRNVPVEQAIRHITELWNSSMSNVIPMPSYIEYGNQFRLIYSIKGHLGNAGQFKAAELVAKRIVHALNSHDGFDFHAEAQPLNSYIRFPESVNMKKNAGRPVIRFEKVCPIIDGHEIDMETEKTLEEYMEEVLGAWEKPDWYEKWKEGGKKKKSARSLKELNLSRMEAIKKIQKYYTVQGEIGYRDKLCFAYYIHAKQYFDCPVSAAAALEDFNAGFTYPLSSGKLKNCICTAMHKDYRMRSATLLEFLGISEKTADILGLGLRTNSSRNADYCRAYRKKEKIKRKRKGQLKGQKIEKAKKKIAAMRKRHISTGRIAAILGLPVKTVERYVSALIKEGRLLKMKVQKKCEDVIASRKEQKEDDFLRTFVRSVEVIGRAVTESGKTEAQMLCEMELFNAACGSARPSALSQDPLSGHITDDSDGIYHEII